MFRSVPRTGSSDLRPPTVPTVAGPEEDDDNISLTSTVPDDHDPEQEFWVEDIHLESEAEDGEGMFYLVEWQNYPLARCTWEPASNIGEELLDMWEEKKEQQRRGEVEAWTWDTWQDIRDTADREHLARHRRRNARRKKLGLPLTEPIDKEEHRPLDHDDRSSEEAEQDGPLAAIAAKKRRSPAQPRKPSSTTTTGSPGTPSKAPRHTSQGDARPRPGLARKVSKDSGPPSRKERPSSTGYQGSARRAPLPGPKTSSGNPGILSAPGKAAGAKVYTARKSVPVPGASNVFAGGKVRKARVGLKDSISDPTKDPKLFTKYRYRRIAEKNSRDQEDRPPPLLSNLFANFDTPSRKKSSGTEPPSATTEKKPPLPSFTVPDASVRRKSTGTEATSAASEKENTIASPIVGNTTDSKQPKKKKSVRFNDDDAPMFFDEPAPMEIDIPAGPPSATSETQNHVPSPVNGSTALLKQPRKKKSVRFHGDDTAMLADEPAPMELDIPAAGVVAEQPVATAKPDIPTRIVQTKLWFGFVHDSEPILSSMDGIPLISEDPWLSEFLKTEILRLEYVCSAKDFAFQRLNLWQCFLCSGTVASGPSGPALETAAAKLREGMLALYHTTSSYSLILYPAGSDEWRSLMAEQGISPSNEGGSGLKYCIFRSPEDVGPFLRHRAAKVPEKNFGSYEEKLLWRLFNFDYQALLPPCKPGSKDLTHHCLLLFPRNRSDWLAALARWIRLSSPSCRIYTSYDAGAWSSFCDATGSASGIVIVHELLSSSLRRIPDLWNRLHYYRDSYWCFSEAIQPQPLFPSLTVPDDVVPPGEIGLVPLFPIRPKRRLALFVTPSFLSSEPKRVYELLQWFYDVWAIRRSPTCRLISAYNLHEYLEDLALQKSHEREDVLEQYKHNIPHAEITANVKGLSREDCAYRFKALSLALELHSFRARDAGPSDVNEDLSPLQYADPSIDPNDEQSLVNWFGWWSSMRLDQFRGFHVIGSNNSIRFNGSRKGSRVIRIPTYSHCTINDPDLVREEVQRMNEAAEAAVVSKEPPQPDPQGDSDPAGLAAPPLGPSRPPVFQSRHLSSEHAPVFKAELDIIRRGVSRHTTLNMFPVSWTGTDQSLHFGDIREEFSNITRWWSFPWAFSPLRPFNTYVGFFYTLTDWNPKAPGPSRTPVRHPWICIYRTVGGIRQLPIGGCELLIWDPAAQYRFPDEQSPREEDLAYGQRMAIQFVREHTSEKNPGSFLEKVWYGGFEHPANVDSPYHIDITLASLDMIMREPYKYIPIYEPSIYGAGYRKVQLQESRLSPTEHASSPLSAPMDIGSPGSSEGAGDDDRDTRIIFHPPRGNPLRQGGRTRCINHLYEQATAARRDDRTRTHMTYDFPVTTEWYDVQRFEGRSFEHVHVAPWESVFNMLKIQPSTSDASRASNAGQDNTPNHSPANVDRIVRR
jgi:chromo domain-containing protein 1